MIFSLKKKWQSKQSKLKFLLVLTIKCRKISVQVCATRKQHSRYEAGVIGPFYKYSTDAVALEWAPTIRPSHPTVLFLLGVKMCTALSRR